MESLDLKRKHFRGLFVKALSGSEKFTCFSSASKRLSTRDLPAVKVLSPHSSEEYLGGPPPCYACKLTVLVSITAGDEEDPECSLDELANEAHQRLIDALYKENVEIRRVKSESEFKEGGSEVLGTLSLWYELSYTVKEVLPREDLKKYKGTKSIFGRIL